MDTTVDPTRRALLAALAGGLALAAPAPRKAKGKKRRQPPLAAAIGVLGPVGHDVQDGDVVFLVTVDLQIVYLPSNAPMGTSVDVVVPLGTAKAMRARLLRAAQEAVSARLSGTVPADRVAVLLS